MQYHCNLYTLFRSIVHSQPDKVALRYENAEITFSQLSAWADALSIMLESEGCRAGDLVAIGHEKKPLSYALMIAALQSGIPYVNLDVASPLARTKKILEKSQPKLLFDDRSTYSEVLAELSEVQNVPLIGLDEKTLPTVSDQQKADLDCRATKVDGSSIAYVMFTSGSTGTPKGVAVTHQNVLHLIAWGRARFKVNHEDNFANLSPMYFDNSVFDFYVGLFSGASLTPVLRNLLTQPYELVTYVGRMNCTIWFSVPSLLMYVTTMKALQPKHMTTLRAFIFGGEGYPKTELVKLYRAFSRQAEIVNVYGPTECTCICSAYSLQDQDFDKLEGLPTLGHLNQNFDYLILDEKNQESTQGELCLIGPNVASGYFNDVEKTEAAFVSLTDPRRYMKRMYRTGDLVREEFGQLFFVGRKDNQIKHMGYRIELEEIEYALLQCTEVRQAAVVYHRAHDAFGKLVGFVACDESVTEGDILTKLSDYLPNYMIPSQVLMMASLPKNANGKVDRKQLLHTLEST